MSNTPITDSIKLLKDKIVRADIANETRRYGGICDYTVLVPIMEAKKLCEDIINLLRSEPDELW